jgi:hypothetical protein
VKIDGETIRGEQGGWNEDKMKGLNQKCGKVSKPLSPGK